MHSTQLSLCLHRYNATKGAIEDGGIDGFGEEMEGAADGDEIEEDRQDRSQDEDEREEPQERGRKHFPERYGCPKYFGNPSASTTFARGRKFEIGMQG